MYFHLIVDFSGNIAQYNRDRNDIEKDLAAIRLCVETRTRSAIQNVVDQREFLIGQIDEHIDKEQRANRYEHHLDEEYFLLESLICSIKHHELANEFRQIQNRYESALRYDWHRICLKPSRLFYIQWRGYWFLHTR